MIKDNKYNHMVKRWSVTFKCHWKIAQKLAVTAGIIENVTRNTHPNHKGLPVHVYNIII